MINRYFEADTCNKFYIHEERLRVTIFFVHLESLSKYFTYILLRNVKEYVHEYCWKFKCKERAVSLLYSKNFV